MSERLVSALEALGTEYSSGQLLEDQGFTPSANYDPRTGEGQERSLRVDLALRVMEALMEFRMGGAGQGGLSREQSEAVLRLHENHRNIRNIRESVMTRGKGKAGRKGEKDKSKDDKVKTDGDKTKGGKVSGDKFVLPQYAISVKTLQLLVRFCLERSCDGGKLLYADIEFPSFLLAVVKAKTEQVSASLAGVGDEGPQSDGIFRSLLSITGSLFRHSMEGEEDRYSCDTVKALFALLSLLLANFPRRKLQILSELNTCLSSEEAREGNLDPLLLPAMKTVMKKVAAVKESYSELEEGEKAGLLSVSLQVFTLLLGELHGGEGGGEEVRKWVSLLTKDFSLRKGGVLGHMVRLLLTAVLQLKEKHGIGVEHAQQLHSLWGDVEPDVSREGGGGDSPHLAEC